MSNFVPRIVGRKCNAGNKNQLGSKVLIPETAKTSNIPELAAIKVVLVPIEVRDCSLLIEVKKEEVPVEAENIMKEVMDIHKIEDKQETNPSKILEADLKVEEEENEEEDMNDLEFPIDNVDFGDPKDSNRLEDPLGESDNEMQPVQNEEPEDSERKCSICGKIFSRVDSLRYHIVRHNPVKQFSCQFCQKLFHVKSALYQHVRRHTGELPHKCSFCSSTFAKRETLKEHLTGVHSKEITAKETQRFQCEYCGKIFKLLKNIRGHLRGRGCPKAKVTSKALFLHRSHSTDSEHSFDNGVVTTNRTSTIRKKEDNSYSASF